MRRPSARRADCRRDIEMLKLRTCVDLHADVCKCMAHISIRDLQKISGEAIGALPGPVAVKSGDRTVGLLVPLKASDPDRLAAGLARAEALAKGHDLAADDAALGPFGAFDPTDWSIEAVRQLMNERSPT